MIGEFYKEIAAEQLNQYTTAPPRGVYRLRVEATDGSGTHNFTQCIPYNASALELRESLNTLPIVQQRGGVTVRRYGKHFIKSIVFLISSADAKHCNIL